MKKAESLVAIREVTVQFMQWGQEVLALDHLSLVVPSGQWVLITGHNGSGKSTLLKVISARLMPRSGSVFVLGKDVGKMSARALANSVFLVHQDPLLGTASTLTVYENLLVADDEARVAHKPRSALVKKYKELLHPLGLADRLRQPVNSLSGGERQLLAMLIAHLRPARVMLLDEPLAAMDPKNAAQGLAQIRTLHRTGKTIIHAAHDLQHIASFADRIVELDSGRIIRDVAQKGERHDADAGQTRE